MRALDSADQFLFKQLGDLQVPRGIINTLSEDTIKYMFPVGNPSTCIGFASITLLDCHNVVSDLAPLLIMVHKYRKHWWIGCPVHKELHSL